MCKHPPWGLDTPGDTEDQAHGAAAPAGAVPERGRAEAPRRGLRTPGCARARQSSLCRHEPPAASVCRWRRRRRRWGPRRHARGRGPGARSPPARGAGVLAPTTRPTSRVGARGSERTGSPAPRLLSATPSGALKGRGEGGGPGRPRDRRPSPRPGLGHRARLPRLALCGVCQPSPGVSARPGRGGRAARAGCRGRGRAGARGGNPGLGLPLPGSLSLSPCGARDWQSGPVTHSPRVHIPGEGSRKVINLHQATFPIT